jgi:D-sedoheptulose 7-phosphate isomerase
VTTTNDRPTGTWPAPDLQTIVAARFERSIVAAEAFFAAEAERIAEACWAMARRFHQGGRLLAFGNGAWATDAQHVSVEFVHPVIVGKRALPALALTNDSAALSGLSVGSSAGMPFARQLAVLAHKEDIALGFSPDGRCANVLEALREARGKGLLALALAGGDGGLLAEAGLDFCFVVPDHDPLVVQETHETLYHILWELVHVFFEHEGLLT